MDPRVKEYLAQNGAGQLRVAALYVPTTVASVSCAVCGLEG